MNIDELEKLARAAQGKDYTPVWEFIQAANPAAILELIDSNKKLLRSLESAANYIDTLGGSSLGIRQSIARANGERND